jgi:hypothetical protein
MVVVTGVVVAGVVSLRSRMLLLLHLECRHDDQSQFFVVVVRGGPPREALAPADPG